LADKSLVAASPRQAIRGSTFPWPEKLVAVFGRFFWSHAVACDVFRYDAGDEEVQQIICTAGLGAAAAHFKSAKGMTADDCAGARARLSDVIPLEDLK